MRLTTAASLLLLALGLPAGGAFADGTYQALPFSQDWTSIGLITVSDNWAGVPGVLGYRGDHASLGAGVDPRTTTFDDTPANTGVATSPPTLVDSSDPAGTALAPAGIGGGAQACQVTRVNPRWMPRGGALSTGLVQNSV